MAEASPDDDHSGITDSPFRHLGADFLVGLAILLLAFGADEFEMIPTDWVADRLLPYYVNTDLRSDRAEQFLFIDIDADTLADMGEPLITPRDALAELLEFATQGKVSKKENASGEQIIEPRARVVIVDIALSHRTDRVGEWIKDPDARQNGSAGSTDAGCPQRFGESAPSSRASSATPLDFEALPNPDRYLASFFQAYQGATPIILARGFSLGVHDSHNVDHARPEKSFLDNLPAIVPMAWYGNSDCDPNYKDGRIFWAAPLFERDSDLIVRRWHLWRSWCRDKQAGVLPSVQLLAVALAQKGRTDLQALRSRMLDLEEMACIKSTEEAKSPFPIEFNGAEIDLKSDQDGRRIIYTAAAPRPVIADKVSLDRRQSEPSPAADKVVTLPAHLILDPSKNANSRASNNAAVEAPPAIDASILDDRIVVIGASHPQARDEHATPIGGMSGAMLIINAIQSLSTFGTLKPVPTWQQLVYSVLVMMAVVSLFYALNFRLAVWISGLGMLAITVWVSSWFMQAGSWLNVAIPATGLAWFAKVVAPIAAVRAFQDQGWRAVLHRRLHRKKVDPAPPTKTRTSRPTAGSKKRAPSRKRKASK